jgi:hypothetical protein
MKKRKKTPTTKNNHNAKPPITKLAVINGDCNGKFCIVTDFTKEGEFERIYLEWFNSPMTIIWRIESFILYVKSKYPGRICLKESDYNTITKGHVIHATKEEYLAENN